MASRYAILLENSESDLQISKSARAGYVKKKKQSWRKEVRDSLQVETWMECGEQVWADGDTLMISEPHPVRRLHQIKGKHSRPQNLDADFRALQELPKTFQSFQIKGNKRSKWPFYSGLSIVLKSIYEPPFFPAASVRCKSPTPEETRETRCCMIISQVFIYKKHSQWRSVKPLFSPACVCVRARTE